MSVSSKVKVICSNCETAQLIPLYDSEDILHGYRCKSVKDSDYHGEGGCYTVINPRDYRQMASDIIAQQHQAKSTNSTESNLDTPVESLDAVPVIRKSGLVPLIGTPNHRAVMLPASAYRQSRTPDQIFKDRLKHERDVERLKQTQLENAGKPKASRWGKRKGGGDDDDSDNDCKSKNKSSTLKSKFNAKGKKNKNEDDDNDDSTTTTRKSSRLKSSDKKKKGGADDTINDDDSDDNEHPLHGGWNSDASESESEDDSYSDIDFDPDVDGMMFQDTDVDRIEDLADDMAADHVGDDHDNTLEIDAVFTSRNNVVGQHESLFAGLPCQGFDNTQYERYRQPFSVPPLDPRFQQFLQSDESKKYATIGLNMNTAPRADLHKPFQPMRPLPQILKEAEEETARREAEIQAKMHAVPDNHVPLVVWEPSPDDIDRFPDYNLCPIVVPPVVGHWLRPHQREGVQFMCECILEQRDFSGAGAILADDMGLGKTLQSVALIWTLLQQGFQKDVKLGQKVIVACPTSLVSNWANEFTKWIGEGVVRVLPLLESGQKNINRRLREYIDGNIQVLVLSYEALRRNLTPILKRDCDLLICDEAHRLKNSNTATYKALNSLKCKRRILLSGTPMQNELSEFYSMVNFANPGVLGDLNQFNRSFANPIVRGREPDATLNEKKKGDQCALLLSQIVNKFILRRTNTLLSKHLPPKVISIVCCELSPLQKAIYRVIAQQKSILDLLGREDDDGFDLADIFGSSKLYDDEDDDADDGSGKKKRGGGAGNGKGKRILPMINQLKQLCNHPKMLYDTIVDKDELSRDEMDCQILSLFPPGFSLTGLDPVFSGKMQALDRLMCAVRSKSNDKFVLVSNYTQTLECMEALCKYRKFKFLRVDGSTSIKNRQSNVDKLGAKHSDYVAFLLSSKAGGCGLNLVGANRLILFDPDWNPAVDKQAAGRIWRDGQKKRCYVYRFLSSGTIDEKIFQRQLSKDGLTEVMGGSNQEATVGIKQLRELFKYSEHTPSDTHDTLKCNCLATDGEYLDTTLELLQNQQDIKGTGRIPHLQRGWAIESELHNWSHHRCLATIPDPYFRLGTINRFQGQPVVDALRLKSSTRGPAQPIRQSSRLGTGDNDLAAAIAASKKSAAVKEKQTFTLLEPITEPCKMDSVSMVLSLEVTGKPLPHDLIERNWSHFTAQTFRFEAEALLANDTPPSEQQQPSPDQTPKEIQEEKGPSIASKLPRHLRSEDDLEKERIRDEERKVVFLSNKELKAEERRRKAAEKTVSKSNKKRRSASRYSSDDDNGSDSDSDDAYTSKKKSKAKPSSKRLKCDNYDDEQNSYTSPNGIYEDDSNDTITPDGDNVFDPPVEIDLGDDTDDTHMNDGSVMDNTTVITHHNDYPPHPADINSIDTTTNYAGNEQTLQLQSTKQTKTTQSFTTKKELAARRSKASHIDDNNTISTNSNNVIIDEVIDLSDDDDNSVDSIKPPQKKKRGRPSKSSTVQQDYPVAGAHLSSSQREFLNEMADQVAQICNRSTDDILAYLQNVTPQELSSPKNREELLTSTIELMMEHEGSHTID